MKRGKNYTVVCLCHGSQYAPVVDRPTFGDDVVGGPVALVPTTIASTLVAARAVHPVRTAEAEATTPGLGSTLYCAHCQQIKPHIHDINLLVYIKQIIRFFSTFMEWWSHFPFLFVLNIFSTISFKDNVFRILCFRILCLKRCKSYFLLFLIKVDLISKIYEIKQTCKN